LFLLYFIIKNVLDPTKFGGAQIKFGGHCPRGYGPVRMCVTLVVSITAILLLCGTKYENTTWASHNTIFKKNFTTPNTLIKSQKVDV